jgi:hypothetical protein
MMLNDRPTYRLVLATDIEAFSRRNAEQQQRAQTDLCRALDAAAARAGLDRARWSRQTAATASSRSCPRTST